MEPSIAEPPDVVLRVEGMMCMKNCGTTVQNALRTSSSVKQAIVSFEEGVARVWWQEGKQGDVKSLVESVESVGFDASLLHPSPSPSSSSTTTIPNHPPLAPPSCRGKGGGEAGKEEEEEGGPDYVLEIEGMMCMKSCGTTVQNALRALPGVRLAIVTYPEAMARVWQTKQSNLQGGVEGVKVDATLLIDAVEGVGFGAKLVAGPGERRLNLFRREGGREGGKEGGSPNPAGSSFSVSPRRQALPSLSSPSSAFSNSPGVCRPRGGGRREGGKVMQVVTGRGGGGGAVGAADLAPSVYTHKGHFEIRGMSCAACVGHVERAVMDNVPGVRWVKVRKQGRRGGCQQQQQQQ
ncbi:heavy metal translocating p-type atpase [Nannochloropsis oceanica]